MQTTSVIDTTSDYRRQQLLTEAARDRLANQPISRSSARSTRPKTPLLARLTMAAMLLATSFASPLGGALPAYASSNGLPIDLEAFYNIQTARGLAIGASDYNDAPVTQSGLTDGYDKLWRFHRAKVQNGIVKYEIINVQDSERCLSVYYNSTAEGGKIVIYDCHAWDDQLWTVYAEGSGYLTIRSVSSGLYLGVPDDSLIWGTQLTQNRLVKSEELFGLVKFNGIDGARLYRLTTAWSLAMDVASSNDDAAVIQRPVDILSTSQSWRFLRLALANGHYHIVDKATNKCLALSYGSRAPGGLIVQYACHDWLDEEWILRPTSRVTGAGFTFRSALTGYAIEVPGGTPLSGTQLDQWPLNGATNQMWQLTAL